MQNPAFLSETRLVPSLDFALIGPNIKTHHSDTVEIPVNDTIGVPIQSTDPAADHERPKKKRKGVRFADEGL